MVQVIVLDRPRHAELIQHIRAAGARIRLISDGDVAAAIAVARPDSGVDVLMGVGGCAEGVIAAAALKCMGGAIQGRLWPRHDEDRAAILAAGLDPTEVLTTSRLCGGEVCSRSARAHARMRGARSSALRRPSGGVLRGDGRVGW